MNTFLNQAAGVAALLASLVLSWASALSAADDPPSGKPDII
jgi:hypothetical protein